MSELKLPQAMAELRTSLPDVVAAGQESAPYFATLLSSKQGVRVFVDNREEGVTEIPPSAGSVLTAFDGETVFERAVGGFDKQEIEKAARELVTSEKFDPTYKPEAKPERRGDFVSEMKIDPLELSIQEKLDRCRELQKRIKALDERIVNARVGYNEATEYSVFANSSSDLAQRVQRVHILMVLFVAGSDGQVRYDWLSKSGTGGIELLDMNDEDIESILKSSLGLLKAERIEPGEYQVISAPGVSGTICHESFGHGVETDMFLKERAKAAHFIDKPIGSQLVNIADNPAAENGFGSYFFDDEGQMATDTKIVKDGVFKRGITDFYSATALDIPRSANGRRQDYSRKAYARMSNTYFEAGETPLEDMLAQVDNGIYLDRWSSGMEDPQGWGIQVTCHFGREIKNGKITDRVFAPIGISGYVPKVLGSITAVSNEMYLEPGTCGKGNKELLPVASGGPHLLMRAPLG
ncbi:MAG: TldD/PmbA family protein [Anaerolineales bacterium]